MSSARTLTTETAGSAFHAEHARVMRSLTRDLPALAPPAPGALAAQFHPAVVAATAQTWRERMVNEHRSSAVFAGLLPQLIEASCTLDVQTLVLRAAADEIHHAVLCGEVVRAFGGEPVASAEPTLRALPAHADVAPLERALRNVLFVGCLSETVAVGLITEERELAREPFVREVFTRILGDEVAHARFGWRFVADALPHLPDGARERTAEYLRVAFAYLERNELALLPLTPPTPDALVAEREAVGLCQGEHARALFYATIESVIVPRLEDLGIAAAGAWRTRAEGPRAGA